MLAIFWASRYYKCYIYGRFVVFYTDHEPLEKLQKSKEPDGRLYSMYLKLQNLNHQIVYYPGVKNKTADLLSRPAIASCKTLDVKIEVDWAEEQDNDKELAIVKVNLKADNNLSEYRGLIIILITNMHTS